MGTSQFIYHPAQGHYDSMYGRIESRWERKDSVTTYAFTIPANTSATVILPASSLDGLRLDGKRLNRRLTKAIFDKQKKQVTMELVSGKYEFLLESLNTLN